MPLFSTPGKFEQLPAISPKQQTIQSNILGQIPSLLSGLGNGQSSFAPIKRQAVRQFEQQTVPSIAERFTAMGSGSLSSPAFSSQLGQAGAGLSESLAALQSQYGLEQQRQQQNLLNLLLAYGTQPSFQYAYNPGQQGFLSSLFGSAAQGIGAGLGGLGYGLGSSLLGGLGRSQSAVPAVNALPMMAALQQTAYPRQQSGFGQFFGGF